MPSATARHSATAGLVTHRPAAIVFGAVQGKVVAEAVAAAVGDVSGV
ncbi:MAG: hypothetical protein QOE71_1752 [Pseudonocardiales bacterium]|nr:hypothetical protein [Pseudonocardiales bacterium]